jgi:outer membrane protein
MKILILVTIFGTLQSFGLSLHEAYEAAISKTETIPIQSSLEEQKNRAISKYQGHLYPSLSFIGNYLRQDSPSDSSGSAFTLPDQTTLKFNLTQPLFHGLRDFAELSAAKGDWKMQKAAKESAELKLFESIGKAYFSLLSSQKDLENLNVLHELTQKRIEELKPRTKIGRSRKGELLAAETQNATLLAQLEIAKAALSQSESTFRALTGLTEIGQLDTPLEDPKVDMTLEESLRQISKHPNIVADQIAIEIADDKIDSVWGQHLPSLDATGNYYVKRTGILENSKWDIGIQLTIPLFSGGSINAEVREYHEIKKQKELALALDLRNARRDNEMLFESLSRTLTQRKLLIEALKLAQENYEEQTRDYRLGLVTNLDVLSALNTYQETKRQSDKAFTDSHSLWISWKISQGIIPKI